MANVLSDEKKQQVIALGRLGWTLRRIHQATGVRRETASVYLKAAGIAIQPPGGWGRRAVPKPANEVITDFGVGKPASEVSPDPAPPPSTLPLPGDSAAAKPANEVITDPGAKPAPVRAVPPTRSPSASACGPYRELIEMGLARGRNAMAIWQDLVSETGFTSGSQSVRRFVGKLRGAQIPQAHPVTTIPVIASKGADAKEVGLPLYPGARPHQVKSDDSPAFQLGIWGGAWGFKLVVLKLGSNDPPERVATFYQKALAKYGRVWNFGDSAKAAGAHEKTASPNDLDCQGSRWKAERPS